MKKLLLLSAVLILAVVAASSVGAFTDAPAVGSDAPVFTLTTNEGNQASLKDFRGQWVVLYFYPKDFTGGCTLEAHNFQADLDKYKAMKVVILGVSVDTADSHKSFCTKESLNFKLLADTEHHVAASYGSLADYQGTAYASRNTFLIDPSGVIRKVYLKVKPAGHSDEVLADLDTLTAKK